MPGRARGPDMRGTARAGTPGFAHSSAGKKKPKKFALTRENERGKKHKHTPPPPKHKKHQKRRKKTTKRRKNHIALITREIKPLAPKKQTPISKINGMKQKTNPALGKTAPHAAELAFYLRGGGGGCRELHETRKSESLAAPQCPGTGTTPTGSRPDAPMDAPKRTRELRASTTTK